jgi:hypothetical protein
MTINQISLKASSIARGLGAINFLLVIASTVGQFSFYLTEHRNLLGFVPLFYFDGKRGIPTFFHVSILFMAAVPFLVIYLLKKKLLGPYAPRWAVLSFGFLFMAYDLASGLHRTLTAPMHALLGASKNTLFNTGNQLGIFRYA